MSGVMGIETLAAALALLPAFTLPAVGRALVQQHEACAFSSGSPNLMRLNRKCRPTRRRSWNGIALTELYSNAVD